MENKYILTKTGSQRFIANSNGTFSRTMSPPFNSKLGQSDVANSYYTIEIRDALGEKINLNTSNIITIDGNAPDNSSSNAFFQQVVSFFPSASASGGVGAFSKEFLIADWIANTGVYSITINSSEHGKTAISDVIIYKNTGGIYSIVYMDSVNVDSFLGVEINVLDSPDMRFDGRVVIL